MQPSVLLLAAYPWLHPDGCVLQPDVCNWGQYEVIGNAFGSIGCYPHSPRSSLWISTSQPGGDHLPTQVGTHLSVICSSRLHIADLYATVYIEDYNMEVHAQQPWDGATTTNHII